jgi:hypothetical protein
VVGVSIIIQAIPCDGMVAVRVVVRHRPGSAAVEGSVPGLCSVERTATTMK